MQRQVENCRVRARTKGNNRGRFPSLLALGLLLILAACGPTPLATPPATPVSPLPTATPLLPGPPASVTSEVGQVVTLDNYGQTITLHRGERFLLNLGEEYDWIVTVADPAVVDRVPNITVVLGAQGVYEAKQAGTTTLTAVGDPPCRKYTPPCGAPSRQFEVALTVQ